MNTVRISSQDMTPYRTGINPRRTSYIVGDDEGVSSISGKRPGEVALRGIGASRVSSATGGSEGRLWRSKEEEIKGREAAAYRNAGISFVTCNAGPYACTYFTPACTCVHPS